MMNQQIIDNNKLIAEFMGAKPNMYTLNKDRSRNYFYEIQVGDIEEKVIKPKAMQFNTDWNWLMPVVKKIRLIVYSKGFDKLHFTVREMVAGLCRVDIEAVYESVVDFIECYNKKVK